jgi:hypothetical protein
VAWKATSGDVKALAQRASSETERILPGAVAVGVATAAAIATRSLRPTPRLLFGIGMVVGGIGLALTAKGNTLRSMGTGLAGAGTLNVFTRF